METRKKETQVVPFQTYFTGPNHAIGMKKLVLSGKGFIPD